MNILKLKHIVLALFLLQFFSQVLIAQPSTPEQLKDELQAAMKAKDKDKISALFYWVGVGNMMKEYSQQNIDKMAEYPPEKIEILPLPDGFQTEFVRDGLRYIPNVKLVGMFRVIYGEDGPPEFTDAKIPYGVKDGKYYLPNTIVQPE